MQTTKDSHSWTDPTAWSFVVMDDDAWSAKYLIRGLRDFFPHATFHHYDGQERNVMERCHGADAIIMDMALGIHNGVEYCAQLRYADNITPVLGITSFLVDDYRQSFIDAGGQGLLHKEHIEQVAMALRAVVQGQPMDGFPTPAQAFDALIQSEQEPLTPREQQVIDEYRHTGSAEAVAQTLHIAVATVHKHLQNIRRKQPFTKKSTIEFSYNPDTPPPERRISTNDTHH